MLKRIHLLPILILFLGIIISCNKKDTQSGYSTPPAPHLPAPTITSFTITDFCSRKVTIIGTNFNPDITKDSVFFGNVKGIIDSSSATKIVARYPAGIPFTYITIYSNGLSTVSAGIVVISSPVITSFSPSTAGPGANITITGQNFNPIIAADSVFFNNVKADIVSVTSTQIIVKVPQTGSSGLITVYSNCQSVTSSISINFSNKGIVYASSNSGVCYAIDISSGTSIWSASTNSGFRNSPTYSNGVIYIGSSDVNTLSNNYMYALNAITGAQLWNYNAGPWDQIAAINQGVLFAGGFDKKLYALDALTGQKIWSYTAGDYFRSDGPTYYNGKVYCRNDDSYFYCLDATTGNLIWRVLIYPGGNPSAVNGIIYAVGSAKLYALDAVTGVTIWSRPIPYLSGSSPTVVNGTLYIAAENHQIYSMNAATGTINWQLEASWEGR